METISTLHQWLTWIKANFSLNVKRIMIDCGSAETSAIRDVFEGPVQILLFHWHIKRAWETHIKRDAKISKSSHDTKLVRDRVCANLNSMMYSETPKAFDLAYQLFLAENMEFEVFLAYFNRLRLPRKKLWSKAWKQTASFHTNNMIESYHNQLKTFYLGHSRSLRVDRLVYLLSQVVALDYWQDTIKAAHDFGGFRLTANEEKKGRAAYCIDYDVACSMIEQLEENVYQCRSFIEDILFYEMDTKEGYLKNCSCPDQTKMCKHIFLVSRVTKLLFLLVLLPLLRSKKGFLPQMKTKAFFAVKYNLALFIRFASLYQMRLCKACCTNDLLICLITGSVAVIKSSYDLLK
ncbi:unnamed protein product [Rhizopus microsporus]